MAADANHRPDTEAPILLPTGVAGGVAERFVNSGREA